MTDLPDAVAQAGVLLQNPLALQDAQYRRMIIDWGYQQIDAEYPLDPVRAPLNQFRQIGARMEWERTIRTNGKELRSTVAGTAVRELQHALVERPRAGGAQAEGTAVPADDSRRPAGRTQHGDRQGLPLSG